MSSNPVSLRSDLIVSSGNSTEDKKIIKLEADELLKSANDNNIPFLHFVHGFDIDQEGNVFILNGDYRIHKFSLDGYYLLTFSRKGQGPGGIEKS